MATRIDHYYFSGKIALKQLGDERIIGTPGTQQKNKQNLSQIIFFDFRNNAIENSQKWNSNRGYISCTSQPELWPVNCKWAFQNMAL
jgi:hypothetical protein